MGPVMVALVFLFLVFQPQIATAQGNAQAGKARWESADGRCKDCHGAAGEGGFGPDLAGRQLSFEQFKLAVRKPWGIMPAFVDTQHSDQDLADFLAYFSSLPRVAEPGPWRTPVPPDAPSRQQLMIATFGCGQCHGTVMQGPRADAGAIAADFNWFKRMTYEHTTVMPEHRKLLGEAPAGVRMGNYPRTRVPELLLEEIWRYIKDDLKFRVPLVSRLTAGTPVGTYSLALQNEGLVGKGLTAEDITISLALTPGTKVTNATGTGYQGVRNDPQAKADVAVWQLPRLGPKEQQNYTITVASGGGIARGQVRWTRPAQGTGTPDQVNVAMPAPPQTR